MSSSHNDEDVRRRILRNARAAEWERLRNMAAAQWPGLTSDELDIKALELQREKLSAAGKRGRELQRQALQDAAAVRAILPEVEIRLLEALDVIRSRSVIASEVDAA